VFRPRRQCAHPEQANSLWPLLDATDLVGAVHLPRDGQTNPIDTTQALAKAAKAGGARIFENEKVYADHHREGVAKELGPPVVKFAASLS